jgi:hypothetical protein
MLEKHALPAATMRVPGSIRGRALWAADLIQLFPGVAKDRTLGPDGSKHRMRAETS